MSFVRYNPEDSTIDSQLTVRPAWGGDVNEITAFYTSSDAAKDYYLNVYKDDIDLNSLSEVQFSIQYGNLLGTGSIDINSGVPGLNPTRITYGTYRNLIYGDENTNFSFNANVTSSDIFVISVARSRYKESLQAGSFNLKLTSGSDSLYLTDNSKDVISTSFIGSNRYYTIVSGSNGLSSPDAITNPSGSYGYVFPDLGLAILNPSALKVPAVNGGLNSNIITSTSPSTPNPNLGLLYKLIKAGTSFKLKSQETVSSRFFFTRIKNSEFNYTTNPSIIDSNGNILYATLVDNPQTFVTTVGLYNDNNELLAVAKLSKPLTKDFCKEALIRLKLDF